MAAEVDTAPYRYGVTGGLGASQRRRHAELLSPSDIEACRVEALDDWWPAMLFQRRRGAHRRRPTVPGASAGVQGADPPATSRTPAGVVLVSVPVAHDAGRLLRRRP